MLAVSLDTSLLATASSTAVESIAALEMTEVSSQISGSGGAESIVGEIARVELSASRSRSTAGRMAEGMAVWVEAEV